MERLVTLLLLITRVAGNFDASCIPAHAEYTGKTCVSSSSYTVVSNTASECLQSCLDDTSCLAASYTTPTQCLLNEGDCSLQDTAGSTAYIVARNNPRLPTAGCLIVRSGLGEPVTAENTASFVQCRPEEVVTFCDCLPNQPSGTCNGISITNSATRCNAWGGPIGETVRAIAWCGRGTMPSLSVSSPDTETFMTNPEVTCPTTSPLLIGCYVQTDSINVGFQTLGIQDVSTCQAQEGCNSCRVTAVCTSSPGPGQDTSLDSGNCQCARTVMGPPVSVDVGDNQSKAICAEGEVVTTCACLSTNGDQNVCEGVFLNDVRTCTASSREDFTTNTVTANACCSKLGGDVQLVQDPAPIAEYTSNPSASCPAGYSVVGCFVSSTDDTGQFAFPSGNMCSTLPSCTSCKVFAICLQRAQCEVTTPTNGDWTEWTAFTPCSVTCGTGTRTRTRTCTNPAPSDGGATCTGEPSESEDCSASACPIGDFDGTCIPSYYQLQDKACGNQAARTLRTVTETSAADCAQACIADRLCFTASFSPTGPDNCRLMIRCNIVDAAGDLLIVVVKNDPIYPTDDCLVTREERGAINNVAGVASFVQCFPWEVITRCDCEPKTPLGICNGVSITDDGRRCNAWGGSLGLDYRAIAWCGYTTVQDIVVPDPNEINRISSTCSGDTNRIFGCYVRTDSTFAGFDSQGTISGNRCDAPSGCTACNVGAMCAANRIPGESFSVNSGICECAHKVTGEVASTTVGDNRSRAECDIDIGETVSFCDCVSTNGDPNVCEGIAIEDGGRTCVASSKDSNSVTANACCGRFGGNVQVITNPPDDSLAALPSVTCPAQTSLIGCYVRSTTTTASPQLGIRDGATCRTSAQCTSCKVYAICFARTVCPINGDWTVWTAFTPCSVTCGTGTRTRTRTCTNPAPSDGGATCTGESSESEVCTLPACIIDNNNQNFDAGCLTSSAEYPEERCAWEEVPFSTTTKPTLAECKASCLSDIMCNSASWKTNQQCDLHALGCLMRATDADSTAIVVARSTQTPPTGGCAVGRAESGDPVSITTGENQSRVTCADGETVTTCTCAPSDGNPSTCEGIMIEDDGRTCVASSFDFNTVTAQACCSALGGDTQALSDPTEFRWKAQPSVTCPNDFAIIGCYVHSTSPDPVPSESGVQNGATCTTTALCTACRVHAVCFKQTLCPLPVNGGWTEWTEFTTCGVTCGGGSRTRSRTCTNPEPADGGLDCSGEPTERENCNTAACPPPIDASCARAYAGYEGSTCLWTTPPLTSTKQSSAEACGQACANDANCRSARFTTWTADCEFSSEACTPTPNVGLTAVVMIDNTPANPTDACLVVRESVGQLNSGPVVASIVQCGEGEVVTNCRCETQTPTAVCTGVVILDGGKQCNAFGSSAANTYRARGSCGRTTGEVSVESSLFLSESPETSISCQAPFNKIIGCYVNAVGSVEGNFNSQGTIHGTSCQASACQGRQCFITAVCAKDTAPGDSDSFYSGYCQTLRHVSGDVATAINFQPSVDCADGETVTSCECWGIDEPAKCKGQEIRSNGRRCMVFPWTAAESYNVLRAKAGCGRVGGDVQLLVAPSTGIATGQPSVTCPVDYTLIGCYIYNFVNSEVKRKLVEGNTCTTTAGCLLCRSTAVCLKTTECSVDGGWSTWVEFGQCTGECGQGQQVRRRYCTNPRKNDQGADCQGVSEQSLACTPVGCDGIVPYILVAANDSLHTISLDGTEVKRLITTPRNNGGFVAYDLQSEIIFYSVDIDIRSCSLTGTDDKLVIPQGPNPTRVNGVAVDIVGKKLFWRRDDGVVLSSDYNGENEQTIFPNSNPDYSAPADSRQTGITVDEVERRVYWLGGFGLNSADLDGANVKTWSFQSYIGTNNPAQTTFALDKERRKVYWIEEVEFDDSPEVEPPFLSFNNLHVFDLRTETDTVLQENLDSRFLVWSIAIFKEQMYFTFNSHFNYKIVRTDLSGNGLKSEETFEKYLTGTMDITVIASNQAVNGDWSDWSDWDQCSTTCDDGLQTRARTCDNPSSAYGGADCVGEACETRVCNEATCSDGGTGFFWSQWSDCPTEPAIPGLPAPPGIPGQCGAGVQTRVCVSSNPPDPLNPPICSGQTQQLRVCGDSCLDGYTTKGVDPGGPPPSPVDGDWGPWSPWNACSSTCGPPGGTQSRLRDCNNPVPQNGGLFCLGDAEESRDCNTDGPVCPVDGGWSTWTGWTPCTESCGPPEIGGVQTRTRVCAEPEPANNGQDCVGQPYQIRKCIPAACTRRSARPLDGYEERLATAVCAVIMNTGVSSGRPGQGGESCTTVCNTGRAPLRYACLKALTLTKPLPVSQEDLNQAPTPQVAEFGCETTSANVCCCNPLEVL